MSAQARKGPKLFGGGRRVSLKEPTEKPQNFSASLVRLLKFLQNFQGRIVLVMCLAVLATLFNTIGPKILSYATDELVGGLVRLSAGTGSIDFAYIRNILLQLLVLYLASAGFLMLMGYIIAGLTTDISYTLRNEIVQKINRLPLASFHNTTNGEILSRITNDVDAISQSLNQSITQIITSLVTLIGVIAMMLTISWQLALVSFTILPLSLAIISFITKRSQKYFLAQFEYMGNVSGHVEEMYSGHLVIKAFNREAESISKFNEQNDWLCSATWQAEFRSGLMMPFVNFIGNLTYVAVCIVGAWLTTSGSMTIGGIQAFIQYVRTLNQPIAQAANFSSNIQQMVAASERVFDFLEQEEEDDSASLIPLKQLNIHGNVDFDQVQFGYEPEKLLIKDFTARVKAGQKIAIVGPTGAGKTTVVKLLMRFYDLDGGAIYIDGQDITNFSKEDLRSLFGMVLQDAWLFSGTILENIRYGRLDATDEEVIKAAEAAQVDHFIRTLPDGYQMEINEEVSNISQGQKQLLTIARAILADAKILILDEATSSVDTRTEVLLQKAMQNLQQGRTSFVIAHRLSTIRNADLILCLNEGDIVEQGTHAQLMKLNGFYAQLYNSQFEEGAS